MSRSYGRSYEEMLAYVKVNGAPWVAFASLCMSYRLLHKEFINEYSGYVLLNNARLLEQEGNVSVSREI